MGGIRIETGSMPLVSLGVFLFSRYQGVYGVLQARPGGAGWECGRQCSGVCFHFVCCMSKAALQLSPAVEAESCSLCLLRSSTSTTSTTSHCAQVTCRDGVLLFSDSLDALSSFATDAAHKHFKGPLLIILTILLAGFVLISVVLVAAMIFSLVASAFAKPIPKKED